MYHIIFSITLQSLNFISDNITITEGDPRLLFKLNHFLNILFSEAIKSVNKSLTGNYL